MIDAHHHFWTYDPARHGWIPDAMAAIRRDWTPGDLRDELKRHNVDRVVTIEAGASEEETRRLLAHAAEVDYVAGVVGWVDLAAADAGDRLDHFRQDRHFVGVRHVVQAEADGFLDRDDFNAGVAALCERDLAYDLLIFERQLPEASRFADRHPAGRFVLDHLAKPRNDLAQLEPWAANLRDLARREHVVCKLSGGITEADLTWTPDSLRPYFNVALEAFGPGRLMFGSNWPLSEAAGGYGKWIDAVRDYIKPLSADERASIMGRVAATAYRLEEAQ